MLSSSYAATELLQPLDLACGTLFRSSCAIQTSPTDWRDTFIRKHERGALWLLICGALQKHALTYSLARRRAASSCNALQTGTFSSHIFNASSMTVLPRIFFLQCFDTVGWIIWPVKACPRYDQPAINYHIYIESLRFWKVRRKFLLVSGSFLSSLRARSRTCDQFCSMWMQHVNIQLFQCHHCRFTGSVKLKGIIVIGGEEDTHPSVMKLYVVA